MIEFWFDIRAIERKWYGIILKVLPFNKKKMERKKIKRYQLWQAQIKSDIHKW